MVSCLLIEKDDAQRQRLAAMLETLGMDCTSVALADDGLALFEDLHPDVVVMEANEARSVRPFLRLARHEAKAQRAPVLLFYSRNASMDVIGETILNGAAEFLMLPFDKELLSFKLKQSGIFPPKAA
jgi:two-component system, chemotaxis family, chemotaxis protein CheY